MLAGHKQRELIIYGKGSFRKGQSWVQDMSCDTNPCDRGGFDLSVVVGCGYIVLEHEIVSRINQIYLQ